MADDNYDNLNSMLEPLRSSWFDLLQRSTVDLRLGEQIFTSLVNSYCDRERSYHNLQHISDILNSIEQVREKL